jgi:hypothetical protein
LGLVLCGAAAGNKLLDPFLGMLFLGDFTLDLAVVAVTVLTTKILQHNSEVKL